MARGFRAEDRARTGHPDLGKVVLYQMSYFRMMINTKELKGCKNKALAFFEKNIFTLFYLYWGVYNVLSCTGTAGFSKRLV